MRQQQEQEERLFMLMQAFTEAVEKGVSSESLEILALESGLVSKAVYQIIEEVALLRDMETNNAH